MEKGTVKTKSVFSTANTSAISKAERDMTSFCALLNNTLDTLKRSYLLYGVIDVALLRELSCYNTNIAEKRLQEQANEEANNLPPFQRSTVLNSVSSQKEQLRLIVGELANAVEKNRLKMGLMLEPFERALFVTAEDDKASFDAVRIKETYTTTVESDAATQYVEEAKALFEQICAFDRKTRLLSGNRVRGVCENNSMKDGVIECYNGKIELDLTRLMQIDFTTDPAILQSSANPGIYKITDK